MLLHYLFNKENENWENNPANIWHLLICVGEKLEAMSVQVPIDNVLKDSWTYIPQFAVEIFIVLGSVHFTVFALWQHGL